MSVLISRQLKIYENLSMPTRTNYSGAFEETFSVRSGSRLLITVNVKALSAGASIVIDVGNDYEDAAFPTLTTITATGVGTIKKVILDFNHLFQLRGNVVGGTADFSIGVIANDNAVTTNIDSAVIDVELNAATDSVSVPGVSTSANQATANASLASIDAKLTSPLAVAGNVAVGDLNAAKDDVATAGTEDGTATGTVRHFVNNRRQQIVAAHDRIQSIVYADFGTKDQRVTSIVYTSPTFPGITASKVISYTLVGTRYRRDNITWSIT